MAFLHRARIGVRYLAAYALHLSGVLAVVTTGVYLG
jgi:NhaP-type Na+/H+ or K+/H+ antiporter